MARGNGEEGSEPRKTGEGAPTSTAKTDPEGGGGGQEEAACLCVFLPNMEMRSSAGRRRTRMPTGLLKGQASLSKPAPLLKLLPMRRWRPTRMVLFCLPPPGFGTAQGSPGCSESRDRSWRVPGSFLHLWTISPGGSSALCRETLLCPEEAQAAMGSPSAAGQSARWQLKPEVAAFGFSLNWEIGRAHFLLSLPLGNSRASLK